MYYFRKHKHFPILGRLLETYGLQELKKLRPARVIGKIKMYLLKLLYTGHRIYSMTEYNNIKYRGKGKLVMMFAYAYFYLTYSVEVL